jgi:phosphoribosylpyrophosphate synthetase
MDISRFVVYGATGNHTFDQRVLDLFNQAQRTSLGFSHIHHSTFSDGESGFKLSRPEKVAGKHVVVFACPFNAKLYIQFQDIVMACRHQYEADTVTVVLSFLPRRRQDHKEKKKEITRLRWFIKCMKFWGVDRLVVCEPHNVENTQAFCDETGIQLYVADPTKLFAEAINGLIQTLGRNDSVVFSPDFGSVGRAICLAKEIRVPIIASPKRRVSNRVEMVQDDEFLSRVRERYGDEISVSSSLKDVAGKHVWVREDEVASGSTSRTTAMKVREAGAESVRLLVTHPVCTWGWKLVLFPDEESHPFDGVWFGNTRPRGVNESEYEGSTGGDVITVDMAPILAETLIRVVEDLPS